MNEQTQTNADFFDVDEAKARILKLQQTEREVRQEIDALLLRVAHAVAMFKIGQRVMYRNAGEFEITRIELKDTAGEVRYYGRKVLKAGGLHANERELWSYNTARDLRPVSQ